MALYSVEYIAILAARLDVKNSQASSLTKAELTLSTTMKDGSRQREASRNPAGRHLTH
jgi:hypothetical protein